MSTSPSLTGTLLAIGAPVVASAATTPSGMTDDQGGFFSQWSGVAADRGVAVLYRNLELDLDAIETFEPDLIIGSANGGDSTLDAYSQLSDIAPTVLLDYGASSWEELADQLGTVTGLESEAAKTVDEYDSWVTTQAAKIKLPEQPVTALVYMGADGVWTFRADSPQGNLLASLGFTYAEPAEQFVAPDKRGCLRRRDRQLRKHVCRTRRGADAVCRLDGAQGRGEATRGRPAPCESTCGQG